MGEDNDAPYSTVEGFAAHADGLTQDLPASERDDLTIGEMARELGVTPRALRFYESKGLVAPRREGSARFYGPGDQLRLALILKAKALGFMLCEIRQMLVATPRLEQDTALTVSRRQCYEQIKHLEQRKREIEAALVELRHTYSSFYARMVRATG